jgi:hypothetical protein
MGYKHKLGILSPHSAARFPVAIKSGLKTEKKRGRNKYENFL